MDIHNIVHNTFYIFIINMKIIQYLTLNPFTVKDNTIDLLCFHNKYQNILYPTLNRIYH